MTAGSTDELMRTTARLMEGVAVTPNAIQLAVAAVLLAAGVAEFIMRRGAIGVALIVLALALIGMVVEERMSDPDAQARRRREGDEGPS